MPAQDNNGPFSLLTLQEIGRPVPIRMMAYCPNACASSCDIAMVGGEFFTVEAVADNIPGDAISMMTDVENLAPVEAIYTPAWTPAASKEAF